MSPPSPTPSASSAPARSAGSRLRRSSSNADGYPYVVAPMVDGFTWQGFSVNGNMQVTKNQPGMGLRQVQGNDPANPTTDSFSLGQGTPQVWEPNNYAAGVAFCETAHRQAEQHSAQHAGPAPDDGAD